MTKKCQHQGIRGGKCRRDGVRDSHGLWVCDRHAMAQEQSFRMFAMVQAGAPAQDVKQVMADVRKLSAIR